MANNGNQPPSKIVRDDEGGDRSSPCGGFGCAGGDGEKLDSESSIAGVCDGEKTDCGIVGSSGTAASKYCESESIGQENLVRKTYFLSQSVHEWLAYWAIRHKMRSPSQFLNALLQQIKKEHGE